MELLQMHSSVDIALWDGDAKNVCSTNFKIRKFHFIKSSLISIIFGVLIISLRTKKILLNKLFCQNILNSTFQYLKMDGDSF